MNGWYRISKEELDFYGIIEEELAFYLNFDSYVENIREQITENENEVSYPQSYVSDIGEIVRIQSSVEQEVLIRFERREILSRQLDRAFKRKERFLKAIEHLDPSETELLFSSERIPVTLLQKIYSVFIRDRALIDQELKRAYKAQFSKEVSVTPC